MTLVFIDTETGGLNPERFDLVEVAWATLENPEPKSLILPHDPARIGEEAKKVNRYDERDLSNKANWADFDETVDLIDDLAYNNLMGANIGFDEAFLKKTFGFTDETKPWHYRKVDIESIAYHAFGYPDKVPGMKDIHKRLVEDGHVLPEPDHTAAGDVRALIAAYKIIKENY